MKIRVLIVDDEPLARDVIRHCLSDKQHVEIVAECGHGFEALDYLKRGTIDLLYLDVQMPEMDGFSLLGSIDKSRIPVVVFVTAHDKYALKAFEAHALDYLLKPFDKERFDRSYAWAKACIEKSKASEFQDRLRAFIEASELRTASVPAAAEARNGHYPSRFTLREDGKVIVVRVAEICWLQAEGDYVRLQTCARRHLSHDTLANLETLLDPGQFVRIHRSAIVNLEQIREMEPYFNGEYHVVMQDGTRLKLSRTYRDRLLEALGQPKV